MVLAYARNHAAERQIVGRTRCCCRCGSPRRNVGETASRSKPRSPPRCPHGTCDPGGRRGTSRSRLRNLPFAESRRAMKGDSALASTTKDERLTPKMRVLLEAARDRKVNKGSCGRGGGGGDADRQPRGAGFVAGRESAFSLSKQALPSAGGRGFPPSGASLCINRTLHRPTTRDRCRSSAPPHPNRAFVSDGGHGAPGRRRDQSPHVPNRNVALC